MYNESFKRNIGWITEWEQQLLCGKRVAIAGMGGVGGSHLLTLVRLGIGAFTIADFDHFERANFNRQMGSYVHTLGKDKATVLAEMAKAINPELAIRVFSEGVTEENIDRFLDGADLFIDGFDAFALAARSRVFARCAERGIPAITAGPIGMGTAYLIFLPGRMTFEEYFRLDGLAEEKQYVHWFLGLAPRGVHRGYLMDPSRLDVANKRAPSIGASCMMSAGVTGIEALKLLLGRGKIYAAPYYHQLDVYRETFVRGYLRGGNRHPLQRLKSYFASGYVTKLAQSARPDNTPPRATALERILDAARWTPSGDNSQPWRFQVIDKNKVFLHVTPPPRYRDIMNIREGAPSLLSGGMMLEAMNIAAGKEGKTMAWKYLPAAKVLAEDVHCFEITFDDAVTPAVADPLFPYIPLRYTNRRYYRTTPLTDAHKRGLEEALGDTLAITWRSNWKERWQMGTLNMQAYAIRMKSRTAYEQLKNQLDWQHPFSADKLPVHTLPVTALSRQIMRWAMVSWRRLETLGKIPGALLPSAMELELLPALFCGAHFIIARKNVPAPENYITAAIAEGRALMRFWLTLTRLGLTMQPSYSPIVFGHYGNHPDDLPPGEQHLVPHCQHLAKKLAAVSGHDPKQIVFMGRIGIPRTTAIASRSLRKPLEALLVEKSQ